MSDGCIDWAKIGPDKTQNPTDLVDQKCGKYKDPVDGKSIEERFDYGPAAPQPKPYKGAK